MPRIQKFAHLVHITSSLGWLGAVVPYLALATAALTSHDQQVIRAALLSLKLIGWFVIVPLSLAALLSGLVQSLGTRWGLFRHWWIVAKLVLTVFAVGVLLQHMRDVSRLSLIADGGVLPSVYLRPELIHSAGGLLVLLAMVTLSVFKPLGMTPYGRRQTSKVNLGLVSRPPSHTVAAARINLHGVQVSWVSIIGYHAIGLFMLIAIVHIAGLHRH